MKKIFTVLTILLCVATGFLTSCDEDYPGPDPVEVTANYSNKFSNANPNLSLTYSGKEMTGKSVDFSTVKGKTANIILYDIIPGESALKLINIPISGDATGYSFSGNGSGNVTDVTFNYEGRVENGRLVIDLFDIKIANSSQWSHSYTLSLLSYGLGKDMIYNSETNLFEWGNSENRLLKAPIFTDMDFTDINGDSNYSFLYANITGGVRGLGSYFIAQLLNGITLEADGNVQAEYSTDEMYLALYDEKGEYAGEKKFSEASTLEITSFIVNKLFGALSQEEINKVTTGINRKYVTSPRGLIYWYIQNEHLYLKPDLAAIITKVMLDKGKPVDKNLIATLTDALLASDPVSLQHVLAKVNEKLNNSLITMLTEINSNDFKTIFSWLKNGIPMSITQEDGETRIYIEKEVLTPIINLLPSLESSFESIPMGTMLYDLYLTPLIKSWNQITKLDVGLGLSEQSTVN